MVTVHDVARECGVSISTVSRALATPQRVAPGTRARVVDAAQRLGYRVNRAASGLRAGRTGALGLVVPDLENPFFASVTKGVQARARAAGHAVFVVDSQEHAAAEAELVAALTEQTDGVILCSPRSAASAIAETARHSPIVVVNREIEQVPTLSLDSADGAGQAVAHLHALGHRRIAYVGGPADSQSDAHRRAGGHEAADRLGVDWVELGAFRPHVAGGRAGADLAVASGATAVIAYNDLVAVGLLERLRLRGLHVPEDLSVVGADDTFVASLLSPQLTTVRARLRDLGAGAVDLLIRSLTPGSGSEPGEAGASAQPEHVLLPVELVVRESTGVPPAHGPAGTEDPR